MQPEGSQQHATGHIRPNPHPQTLFSQTYFNITVPFTPTYSNRSLPFRRSRKNAVCLSNLRHTCYIPALEYYK